MTDALLNAARAMADDYQTSETHHPDHVLVPREAFEAMRDALATAPIIEAKRYLVYCDNGHRSTVPHDATSYGGGSTHACPECGMGLKIGEPVLWQRFDKRAGRWDTWTYIAGDDTNQIEHLRRMGQMVRPLYDRPMEA